MQVKRALYFQSCQFGGPHSNGPVSQSGATRGAAQALAGHLSDRLACFEVTAGPDQPEAHPIAVSCLVECKQTLAGFIRYGRLTAIKRRTPPVLAR